MRLHSTFLLLILPAFAPSVQGQWVAAQVNLPANTNTSNEVKRPILAAGGRVFIGNYGQGIYRSTDDGNTWAAVSGGMTGRENTYSLATDGATLYAGTAGGLYRSFNNGDTWTYSSGGLPPDFIFPLLSAGTTLLAGTSRNGVYRSTDGGTTWVAANTGLPNTNGTYKSVTALDALGSTLLAGFSSFSLTGNPGGTFRSRDGGLTWAEVPGDAALQGVALTLRDYAHVGNTLIASTGIDVFDNGGLYRSNNAGDTWTNTSPGGLPTGGSVQYYTSDLLAVGTTIFAGTNAVYKYAVGGGDGLT